MLFQLLDYEPKASEQVPLLLRMDQDHVALTKAIDSGDSDLGQLPQGQRLSRGGGRGGRYTLTKKSQNLKYNVSLVSHVNNSPLSMSYFSFRPVQMLSRGGEGGGGGGLYSHEKWQNFKYNVSLVSHLNISPLSMSYFSFRPVLHDWCNKGCGMCYPDWDGAYKRTLAVNQKE